MLIDTHAHLHVKDFDDDREAVVARAREAGVDFINVGFDPEGSEKAAQIAKQYKTFWTAGIHPHEAHQATDQNLARVVELAKGEDGSRLVALGELGLDYFKNLQPKDLQIQAFRKQLALSRELNLPVIIHCREAFADTLRILKEEHIERAVFHCFTGNLDEAAACWEQNYLTSFTGIATYPSAGNVRLALQKAPLSQIMIETDSPYLAPQGHRGERNEPAFLRETFESLAGVLGLPEAGLEQALYDNTRIFFNCQFKEK